MTKKALITGVSGQDGAYLAEFLLSKGYCVYGGVRHSSLDGIQRLRILGIQDKISYTTFDLTNPLNIEAVVNEGQFDEIYNLAAKSVVVESWNQPLQISKVNAMGTVHLLDSIKRFSKQSRLGRVYERLLSPGSKTCTKPSTPTNCEYRWERKPICPPTSITVSPFLTNFFNEFVVPSSLAFP